MHFAESPAVHRQSKAGKHTHPHPPSTAMVASSGNRGALPDLIHKEDTVGLCDLCVGSLMWGSGRHASPANSRGKHERAISYHMTFTAKDATLQELFGGLDGKQLHDAITRTYTIRT
eukprot:4719969-Alexandrium_andersonii.AAC.1